MSRIDWPDLQLQLLRGGVTPKFAARTVIELQQHCEDLEARFLNGGMAPAEALEQAKHAIGDPHTIVAEALARPELKSWSSRFPKLVFVATPLIAYPLLLVVLIAGTIVLPLHLLSGQGMAAPSLAGWTRVLLQCALSLYVYMLAPLTAVGLSVFARRRTLNLLWPVLGIAIVAFVGSGLSFDLHWSTVPGQSRLDMTWGYSFLAMPVSAVETTWSLLRLVLTMALCGACLYWYRPLAPRETGPGASA